MRPVAIVGGGISGLSAACHLVKAGARPVLIERQPRLGGVIRTEVVEGCVLEAGPDSFLAIKPAAMELINELGLAGEVIHSNDHLRVTYILRHGRLAPMPDGLMMMVPTRVLPMIFSPLLGWRTKVRMGLEYFRQAGAAAEDQSVADFVASHYGREAVDYLAEPLLAGVYGGDPNLLSVRSVLAQFVELEKKYGSLTRGVLAVRKKAAPAGPLFKTLKGGLGQLTAAIERFIAPSAEVIHATVETVERAAQGFRLRVNGGWLEAAKLILCCPAHDAAALLASVDASLAGLLAGVLYNSSMTLAMGYEKRGFGHPLDGFGFLVPKVERRKLVACTWVGTKFSHRVPDDKVVLRCFLNSLEDSGEAVIAHAREELRDLMGITAAPLFTRIARWPRSMAQYTVGHAGRIKMIRERLAAIPGLHLAGNAYDGIGIPDCIRTGRDAAENCAGGPRA